MQLGQLLLKCARAFWKFSIDYEYNTPGGNRDKYLCPVGNSMVPSVIKNGLCARVKQYFLCIFLEYFKLVFNRSEWVVIRFRSGEHTWSCKHCDCDKHWRYSSTLRGVCCKVALVQVIRNNVGDLQAFVSQVSDGGLRRSKLMSTQIWVWTLKSMVEPQTMALQLSVSSLISFSTSSPDWMYLLCFLSAPVENLDDGARRTYMFFWFSNDCGGKQWYTEFLRDPVLGWGEEQLVKRTILTKEILQMGQLGFSILTLI